MILKISYFWNVWLISESNNHFDCLDQLCLSNHTTKKYFALKKKNSGLPTIRNIHVLQKKKWINKKKIKRYKNVWPWFFCKDQYNVLPFFFYFLDISL